MDAFAEQDLDCTLVAGFLETSADYHPRFHYRPARALQKAPAHRRIWTWSKFTLQSLWQLYRHRDHFALLVTNPPLVPWLGPFIRRWFKTRYAILVYDIYPDVMVRMGMIRAGGFIDRFLTRRSAQAYLRADCVITLGHRMKEVIQAQLPPDAPTHIEVIPNWADIDFLRPVPRTENPFIQENHLTDKRIVMYSGAFGATHDITSIIDAAALLQDLSDVHFVLIGGGTRAKEVKAYAQEKNLPNLTVLPWQPLEHTRFSLTAADFHIISLDAAFEGISVPSKTYTALASQAAIICIGGTQNEVADLVQKHDCGTRVDPGHPQALAQAVRDFCADPDRLDQAQRNARTAAEQHYSKEVCLQEYLRVLMPLINPPAPA